MRVDSAQALISRTRWRLALVTMGLLAALLVGVGATTAIFAIGALDGSVDHALETSTLTVIQRLGAEVGAVPASSATAEPTAPGQEDGGAGESGEVEHQPASADTFFLYLGGTGQVVTNPANVRLPGLPDPVAVAAAGRDGRDLRTVRAGAVRVRLLTLPIRFEDDKGSPVRFVQAGFVLALRDEQAGTLLWAILAVGLLAMAGAAILSIVVTGRALVPIRSAFERERRFVAASSHELRTPIALIRSAAEVLERERLVGPDGASLVTDIQLEADRLGRLVADLSTLATAEAGPPPTVVPVDLADLAADTVRRATPLASDRGVTLAAIDAPEGLIVLAEPDRLVQVVLILLDNALHATPRGGHVTVETVRRGRFGEVSVEDEGPGVPPADRERIFEPFARLPMPGETDGGSGLGLAIARSIVGRLGGTISVGDAPGGGARFAVTVPLA